MTWAPDYVAVGVLAEFVRIPDSDDDAQLAPAISAASRAIDRHCRRQFGLVAAPEARYYRPRWDSRRCTWVVDTDDLMTVTGLLVDGEVVASPVLLPRNAGAEGRPWMALVLDGTPSSEVAVTARWGWTAVPEAVKEACMLQASRLFKRRVAPFGIAGSPGEGSEIRLLAKLDPDVVVSLEAYRRKARPR